MTDMMDTGTVLEQARELLRFYQNTETSKPYTCSVLADCIVEIERLRAASEWRDISTAPRDGKPFWALQGEKHFECWWYEDWPRTDGYWMDHSDSEPEPTHWQPLPAPPQRNEVKK